MKSDTTLKVALLSYSKTQRIGIILFFLIIILMQGIYYCYTFEGQETDHKEKKHWLAHQRFIDSLKDKDFNYKPTLHPFNPNYITDFKGYKLGMSVDEIDRLLAYRKQNKFVNSAQEFQEVTRVSDSLLKAISPYFKFPEWTQKRTNTVQSFTKNEKPKEAILVIDINNATKEDLMKVNGIGDKISERILDEKDKYGAFVSMEQLNYIWGLSDEVIEELNKYFAIKSSLKIKKININNASVKELTQFPFFKYALAKEIVIYRTMNGPIRIEDLTKIKGFPVEKLKIIALYLEF